MIYRVYVEFKPGILDPESEAIKKTVNQLGFSNVENIQKVSFLISNFRQTTVYLISKK